MSAYFASGTQKTGVGSRSKKPSEYTPLEDGMKRRFPQQRAPRTAEEFVARSESFQDRWERMTHVVTQMRKDKESLREVSREYHISPRTVRRLAGSVLRKKPNGRYTPKASDRLLRVLGVLTQEGPQGRRLVVGLRDSRQASVVSEHWNAADRYVQTGDASAIQQFTGQSFIDANGRIVPLLTDLAELDRLASAGVLSFETLYARSA